MARPKRKAPKKNEFECVDEWKLDYILTGTEPPKRDDINPFEALCFTMGPGYYRGNYGSTIPWFEVWEEIKDSPFIKDWEKENGMTYAEKRLKGLIED